MLVGVLRAELRRKLAESSYRAVAGEYGVNPGTVWRIVNQEYEPHRPSIRLALGLSETMEGIPTNGVTMAHRPLILRSEIQCACGCNAWFIPRAWNQTYLPNHRKHRRSSCPSE